MDQKLQEKILSQHRSLQGAMEYDFLHLGENLYGEGQEEKERS